MAPTDFGNHTLHISKVIVSLSAWPCREIVQKIDFQLFKMHYSGTTQEHWSMYKCGLHRTRNIVAVQRKYCYMPYNAVR